MLDRLPEDDVPVHAFGLQAHLAAAYFAANFDAKGYQRFLADLAERGLDIITKVDVLDDGLATDAAERDAAIAGATRLCLDMALQEPAVASVITFGLSDRYTWL